MKGNPAIRTFFIVFAPCLLIISVIGYFIDKSIKEKTLSDIVSYKQSILELKADYISDFYQERLKDLYLVSNLSSLKNIQEDEAIEALLRKDLSLITKATNYYQVRWIDTLGQEIVRVNFKDNQVIISPKSELQNKANRDYFLTGKQLKKNEVYISPIDLNVEFDEVEIPFEPVVRIVKPLFVKDEYLSGMLIFNVSMRPFFERLNRLSIDAGLFDFHITNNQGYWLSSSTGHQTFGFMFDSLRNESIAHTKPDEWKAIKDAKTGHLKSKNGLFVFRQVSVSDIAQEFNNLHKTTFKLPKSEEVYLIGIMSPATLANRLNSHRPILFLGSFALIITVLAIVIAILKAKDKQHSMDLEQANAKLNQHKKLLETKNTQLESFVRVASHDLREPLATIISMTKSMQSKLDNNISSEGLEKTRRGLHFIEESAERMDRLTKAILLYARTGKNSEPEWVECSSLLDYIKKDMQATITSNNVTISYDNLPLVFGFRPELRQLFQNILANAIRYAKPNFPPEINITYEESDSFHIFHIKDNGIGIAKEDQERIFGMFKRASKLEGGLGIGLGIARKIVNLHQGEISIQSEPGAGSTFTFTLSKNIIADSSDML